MSSKTVIHSVVLDMKHEEKRVKQVSLICGNFAQFTNGLHKNESIV